MLGREASFWVFLLNHAHATGQTALYTLFLDQQGRFTCCPILCLLSLAIFLKIIPHYSIVLRIAFYMLSRRAGGGGVSYLELEC